MSHYLIEQLAALPNVDVRTGSAAVAAEGEDGHLRRLRVRNGDGAEEMLDADACFVFIGASPRTDWLDGVVARDERGFILAGLDAQARRLAAEARPLPARDERARRVRGRRRARALDQARGERGRRGLDGRLARPPVPGRRMSDARSPSPTCARSTCSTTSTTTSSREWAAVAQPHDAAPGDVLAEQGASAAGRAPAARGRRRRRCSSSGERDGAGRPPATRRPGRARSPC